MSGVLYLKLRDDPSTVQTLTLPVTPVALPAGTTGSKTAAANSTAASGRGAHRTACRDAHCAASRTSSSKWNRIGHACPAICAQPKLAACEESSAQQGGRANLTRISHTHRFEAVLSRSQGERR